MSTHPHRKLYAAPEGQPPHQITLFKARWIELSEPERDSWYEFIFSTASNNTILPLRAFRPLIHHALGVRLRSDAQLLRFLRWILVFDDTTHPRNN